MDVMLNRMPETSVTFGDGDARRRGLRVVLDSAPQLNICDAGWKYVAQSRKSV